MATPSSAAPPSPQTAPPDVPGAPLRTHRPWGWFETLATGSGYLVKRITILAGCRLSLQRHHHRCEHWVVVDGEGLLEVDGDRLRARPGTTSFIPVGSVHRAAADAGGPLVILEVQRGRRLLEDDIERLADDYGRVIRPMRRGSPAA